MGRKTEERRRDGDREAIPPRMSESSRRRQKSREQELAPFAYDGTGNLNLRDSIYSVDHGASARTSFSSQAPSSRPILDPSPESSTMNHSPSPSAPNNWGGRASSSRAVRLSDGSFLSSYPDPMGPLQPPSAPFLGKSPSPGGSSRAESPTSPSPFASGSRLPSSSNIPLLGESPSSRGLSAMARSDGSAVSLSVNYLPHKFSSSMLNVESAAAGKQGARRRKGAGMKGSPNEAKDLDRTFKLPKLGGGVDAFKLGDRTRMGGEVDDEEEEWARLQMMDNSRRTEASHSSQTPLWEKVKFWKKHEVANGQGLPVKPLRWNRFKWVLFASNVVFSIYAFASFVVCLLLWFDAWTQSDVIRVGNRTELIVSTLAATLGIFTCLLGWAGILMNNRRFLAIYAFLLWIVFIFMLVPGYLTYKRRTYNLEGKINAQWSRDLGPIGRMRIQNQLACCGYYSPYVEATISQTCYSRSILPGCKKAYIDFENRVLKTWYTTIFALVPFHLVVITISLMCSNHVTHRFGKGMMPKAYRLSLESMAVIMDNYAQQLVERYGAELASDILVQSKGEVKRRNRDSSVLDMVPKVY